MASWRKHPIPLTTAVALFAAFLLLLLVSLSLPLIKSIYILEISSHLSPNVPLTSIATTIRFGLWGYCASGYEFAFGVPIYVENYLCSKPKVGYTIDPVILELLKDNRLAGILLSSVTYVLIIHPIACGLTFLISLPAIVRIFHPTIPGAVTICSLLLCILPTLVTTVIFIVDIVLVLVARSRINTLTNGTLSVSWGPAVWMTCAATVCLWIGLIGLSAFACGCCGLLEVEYEILFMKRLKRRREFAVNEKSPDEERAL